MSGGKCLGELPACCHTGSPGGVVHALERKFFDGGTSHVPVGGFPRLRHQQKIRDVDLDVAGFPWKNWGVHDSVDKISPPGNYLGGGTLLGVGYIQRGLATMQSQVFLRL